MDSVSAAYERPRQQIAEAARHLADADQHAQNNGGDLVEAALDEALAAIERARRVHREAMGYPK